MINRFLRFLGFGKDRPPPEKLMSEAEFYRAYLPAIREALAHEVDGELLGVSYYIEDKELNEAVDDYMEYANDKFIDEVAYYMDAKEHGFPSIFDVPIDVYGERIFRKIEELEAIYLKPNEEE